MRDLTVTANVPIVEVSKLVRSRQLPGPEYRRALRLEAGLSLSDMADRLGVTRSAVSRWERGLRNPRVDNRVRYSELLAELKEVVANVR